MKQLGNIEKLPSGSYRLRYKKDGVTYRKTIKASNLAEAKKLLNLYITEIETARINYNNMLFKELATLWIQDYLENNATTSTIEIAISNLRKHVITKLGNYKVKDITPVIINDFVNHLKKTKTKTGQYLSNATCQKIYNTVRAILNYAYRMELINDNPCNRVKSNFENNKKQEIHFYSIEQAKTFLKELENEDIKYQLAFKLALFNGLRRSEICGLKWDDIDFKNKTIQVNQTLQKVRGGTELSKPKTKGSNRILTISDDILELLKECKKNNEHDLVFCGLYPDTLTKRFAKITSRVKLPKIKLHDLRHTCATLLLTNGIDIRTVAGYLGHSNIRTTMIYLHALDDKFKQVSNTINNILK